jgi:transcriptional regulator with XRE-family HTH domain
MLRNWEDTQHLHNFGDYSPMLQDRRNRPSIFRARLTQAMDRSGLSQAALARAVGVDRSTISQLIAPTDRLPGAGLAADLAAVLGTSTDWLLGLTGQPEPLADLLAAQATLTEAPRALIDATIFGWHQEAAGYKIRHVPATLPDMMKTRAMVEWEYARELGRTAEQAFGAFEDRLAWMNGAGSDYEIALPLHELAAFAGATGYYAGLPATVQRGQIDHMADLCSRLYPSLRLYAFDARRVFSAPVTIFGPLRAVIYVGRDYLAFRDAARVGRLSDHFDWLVRDAVVSARDMPDYLRNLQKS